MQNELPALPVLRGARTASRRTAYPRGAKKNRTPPHGAPPAAIFRAKMRRPPGSSGHEADSCEAADLLVLVARAANGVGLAERGRRALRVALDEEGHEEDDGDEEAEDHRSCQFFANFRQKIARFRLYRHRSLQANMRFAAFFKSYQILKLKLL